MQRMHLRRGAFKMSKSKNVINIKNFIKELSDHRVSQGYIDEVYDILQTAIVNIVQWSDNAADVTGNGTLLVCHAPYYLVDHKRALDELIEKHYEKIEAKELKRRQRECAKSSKQMKDVINKNNEEKEE